MQGQLLLQFYTAHYCTTAIRPQVCVYYAQSKGKNKELNYLIANRFFPPIVDSSSSQPQKLIVGNRSTETEMTIKGKKESMNKPC